MSFLWTRAGDVIHSRCTLCSLVLASRLERDIHAGQRAHDPLTCQQRRLDAARAVSPEVEDDVDRCPEGHERAGNTYVDKAGHLVCNACRRVKWGARKMSSESGGTCCGSVELGVAQGRMGRSETASDLTPKPPLSTPTVYRKEAVDS